MSIRAYSPQELEDADFKEFCRLVAEGGQVAMGGLEKRVRRASRLAIAHIDGKCAAIGAIKRPYASYRDASFRSAGVEGAFNFEHELGWIYVPAEHGGKGLAQQIVSVLLEGLDVPVYATSRSGNQPMHHILEKAGFERQGEAYGSGENNEQTLLLFLRSPASPVVSMADWHFAFGPTTERDKILRDTSQKESLFFATSVDLLKHLALGEEENPGRFQNGIEDRLKADPVARAWKKRRTLLRNAPHFSRYRKREYKHYDKAAKAVAVGKATQDELKLYEGLSDEISRAGLAVPEGQILFHGRRDDVPSSDVPYYGFISTSLSPMIARQHARKASPGREYVYVLRMEEDIPCFWGHAGSTFEWEILLPAGLQISETARHSERDFEIIEASVSR